MAQNKIFEISRQIKSPSNFNEVGTFGKWQNFFDGPYLVKIGSCTQDPLRQIQIFAFYAYYLSTTKKLSKPRLNVRRYIDPNTLLGLLTTQTTPNVSRNFCFTKFYIKMLVYREVKIRASVHYSRFNCYGNIKSLKTLCIFILKQKMHIMIKHVRVED